MTDDELLAMPEVEVTAMLERRADPAGLSDPDRERLVRSIMARVDATPVPGPTRTRFGWRSLAASMAGLVLVLAAAGGLIVGMPAAAPGSPSVVAFPTPFELHPTGLRVIDQAELNALLDRHVVGDVIARIDPTPAPTNEGIVVCAGSPRTSCLPRIGSFSRGMPDAAISAVITGEPSLAAALIGQPLDGLAALHLDGSDTVQLLGYLDQGEAMVEPFVASAMALADAARTRPMDRTAMVVSGWLTDRGPRLVDARARLLADADMRATPDDAVLLPDDASSTWTTRNSPDDGTPDNGLFVVRPNPDAPGEWRIVGRLDGDPEPDEGLTMRSTAWTVTCGSVPSDACPLVAAAFERSADGHDGEVASRFSVAPRDTCPADAPAGMRCWQVSIGADGVSDCTVIGLLGASAGAGYGWTSRWTADRAGEGTPRGSDDPESTCE